MSSPFDPNTKRGTEETLEAISRTREWASRIDTKNDVSGVDVSGFINDLKEEESRLREKYRIKTTEVSIDNFVFNQEEKVISILCGDLDEKVEGLEKLRQYIDEDFGRERPLDLSKEELLWLVAQEVKHHINSPHGVETYEQRIELNLDSVGSRPEKWSEQYPRYNRNS